MTGGRYVWPREGVKIGNADAAEKSLVIDVTAESCSCISLGICLRFYVETNHPVTDYASDGRCHVDILTNNEVGADGQDLVLTSLSLPPNLLAYNPYSTVLHFMSVI